MKIPQDVDTMKRLSNAITSRIWWDIVYNYNGDDVTHRDKMNQEYRDRIRQLPNDELEFVFQTHEDGIFQRTPAVLDAITSELTERGLFD